MHLPLGGKKKKKRKIKQFQIRLQNLVYNFTQKHYQLFLWIPEFTIPLCCSNLHYSGCTTAF